MDYELFLWFSCRVTWDHMHVDLWTCHDTGEAVTLIKKALA
jgi:hypothetical protein